MTKVFTAVAEALRALRREQAWSQARLARELQKTANTIARWEQGVRTPPPDTLRRLAVLANSPELSHFFQEAAIGGLGLETLLPAEVPPPNDALVARYRNTILTAMELLATRADRGDGAARQQLAYFADELMERAGVEVPGAGISAQEGAMAAQTRREFERLHEVLDRLIQTGDRKFIAEAKATMETLAEEWMRQTREGERAAGSGAPERKPVPARHNR